MTKIKGIKPRNMRRARLIFVAVSLVILSRPSSVLCQEMDELIRSIDENQQKIQTVTADFRQRQETGIMQKPLVSSGIIKFKRPDRIHWIYLKPEAQEIAIDSRQLAIYKSGSPVVEQYSLARSQRAAQVLAPLMAIFQKTFSNLREEYSFFLEEARPKGLCHFRLYPKEMKIRNFLSRVELWVDKNTGAILRFKMVEVSGDRLTIEFKNLQINPPLIDDDLKIKTPPSVKVQEQSWQ